MSCKKSLPIGCSFFLRALRLMLLSIILTSLVSGNSIKNVPNSKITKHLTATIRLIVNRNCIKPAIKYPNGFLQSKGNLMKRESFGKKCIEFMNLSLDSMIKSNNKVSHHIGPGSSKAKFPKSVKKYLVKLTINAGRMDGNRVTLKQAKSRIFVHFSMFWLVSVYNLCAFEFVNPTETNNCQISDDNHYINFITYSH